MERNFHSEVDLNTRVAPIRRIGGVTGVCVLERGEVLLGQMTLTPEKFGTVVKTLDEMFSDYDELGREIDQVNLGFDGSNLVAMAHSDFRLAVLHQRAEDADSVARAGRRLLQELSEAEDRAQRIEEAGLTRANVRLPHSNGDAVISGKPKSASEPQPIAPPALRRRTNGRKKSTTSKEPQRVTLDELKKATEAIDQSEIAWDVAPPPIPAKKAKKKAAAAEAKSAPMRKYNATEMNWIEFRRVLGSVIGKVMNPAAFNYYVQQEIGDGLQSEIHSGRFREIAHILIEKIPDPVKQLRIRTEVAEMFEDLGL